MAIPHKQIPLLEFSPGLPPTPEAVRGLCLEDVSKQHGTPGLLVRLDDTLREHNLYTAEIIEGASLALKLHANDRRTYTHTYDHLAEVALYIIEKLRLDDDPDVAVAALLHDSIEDHAGQIVAELSGEQIVDEAEARAIGFLLLSEELGPRPVSFIRGVTNPILQSGQDKRVVYMHHTRAVITHEDPQVPVIKLADFDNNAVKNHLTHGPKRQQNDVKYLPAYGLHVAGLYRPDSLVTGIIRDRVERELSAGLERAQQRLEAVT